MSEELFMKYMEYGGGEELGEPRARECVERDKHGVEIRYRDFQKGRIYWASQTNVCVWIEENILRKWHELETKGHQLGFPMADWKDAHGKRLCRFQHGSISYNPVSDMTQAFSEGRILQDLTRGRSLFMTGTIWLIGIVIMSVASIIGRGINIEATIIVSLLTILLGPLTSHMFNLVVKPKINLD
jgi:uncharacterized protein with LGFP repeats